MAERRANGSRKRQQQHRQQARRERVWLQVVGQPARPAPPASAAATDSINRPYRFSPGLSFSSAARQRLSRQVPHICALPVPCPFKSPSPLLSFVFLHCSFSAATLFDEARTVVTVERKVHACPRSPFTITVKSSPRNE